MEKRRAPGGGGWRQRKRSDGLRVNLTLHESGRSTLAYSIHGHVVVKYEIHGAQ